MTDDRLLTVEEVAERLGTGVRYPRYLIETRQIEFVKVGRRKVRIKASVVDELVRRGTVPPRSVA